MSLKKVELEIVTPAYFCPQVLVGFPARTKQVRCNDASEISLFGSYHKNRKSYIASPEPKLRHAIAEIDGNVADLYNERMRNKNSQQRVYPGKVLVTEGYWDVLVENLYEST